MKKNPDLYTTVDPSKIKINSRLIKNKTKIENILRKKISLEEKDYPKEKLIMYHLRNGYVPIPDENTIKDYDSCESFTRNQFIVITNYLNTHIPKLLKNSKLINFYNLQGKNKNSIHRSLIDLLPEKFYKKALYGSKELSEKDKKQFNDFENQVKKYNNVYKTLDCYIDFYSRIILDVIRENKSPQILLLFEDPIPIENGDDVFIVNSKYILVLLGMFYVFDFSKIKLQNLREILKNQGKKAKIEQEYVLRYFIMESDFFSKKRFNEIKNLVRRKDREKILLAIKYLGLRHKETFSQITKYLEHPEKIKNTGKSKFDHIFRKNMYYSEKMINKMLYLSVEDTLNHFIRIFKKNYENGGDIVSCISILFSITKIIESKCFNEKLLLTAKRVYLCLQKLILFFKAGYWADNYYNCFYDNIIAVMDVINFLEDESENLSKVIKKISKKIGIGKRHKEIKVLPSAKNIPIVLEKYRYCFFSDFIVDRSKELSVNEIILTDKNSSDLNLISCYITRNKSVIKEDVRIISTTTNIKVEEDEDFPDWLLIVDNNKYSTLDTNIEINKTTLKIELEKTSNFSYNTVVNHYIKFAIDCNTGTILRGLNIKYNYKYTSLSYIINNIIEVIGKYGDKLVSIYDYYKNTYPEEVEIKII